ncbi:ubiquinone biosynthesis monooxygenase COQ6, mitochondrial [Daphnia magna]|uniref:Ubiquinone biosynthesis monooxygenase COQ6, mitochondrial n=1 Tax=Daphnia magna TaxID=35525 RepID=A0A0N8DCG0_9CRUS|nr:ubiquinone biosynthesis monooxygenase COQ6, mitochondrial [Daphnia magna]KZS06471.1 Ubiquinone biosynthesis monooxygenase COQ6, mitochondrial [Daphnia magna]
MAGFCMNRFFLSFKQACVTRSFRFNHSPAATHYDIIISGGGMVGFAMACSLGRNSCLKNKRILLLESSNYKELNLTAYNHRVCSLNLNSKLLLESLGAWQHIVNARYSPVKKMQVWDAGSDAVITFGRANLSEEIAWIVENDVIQDSLVKELHHKNQVDVQYQSKVINYKLPKHADDAVHVTLEDGSHITTDLIIGADGYNSGLRQAMKTQYIMHDYNQMAVVATLRISESTENVTAWQKFLPSGPIAILPLSNDLSSLVWSTDKKSAQHLLHLPQEIFTDQINQAIWSNQDKNRMAQNVTEKFFQLLKVCRINSREENETDTFQLPPSVVGIEGHQAAFPLSFGHSVNYVSHKAVLIGDAAHRIHPLAGQGVNLGFGDVVALNQVINEAIDNGSDHGNCLYLQKYQSNRQLSNLPVMAVVHGLHLLYGTTSLPQVLLRSLGLTLADSLSSVKKFMIQRASA